MISSMLPFYAKNQKAVPDIEWGREVNMKDFSSYRSKEKGGVDWVAEAQRMADEHQGKSEGEMLKAIYDRALAGKRSGTLTNEQIDSFYEQFAPMLDTLRRKKLKKIVDQLKQV